MEKAAIGGGLRLCGRQTSVQQHGYHICPLYCKASHSALKAHSSWRIKALKKNAKTVALEYYQNYNEKRIDKVLELIDEGCEYQDLIYQEPFRGKEEISAYFDKIERLVPDDIKFVVEDITDGDGLKVGVRWHVELEGVAEFPFSRGVSFYEINEQGKIVFARDIVEPALKPGSAALKGITVVAPLVRRLGARADPSLVPWGAVGMGLFWASYIAIVLLSDVPPGNPAFQVDPKGLERILHESFNFFYVNMALSEMHLSVVPNIAEHPVDEGIFNLISAWSLMWWPLWMADPKGTSVDNKLGLWIGTMFVTNVFLPLYMVLRLIPEEIQSSKDNGDASSSLVVAAKPWYGALMGFLSLGVGLFSVFWICQGRPEFGGLPERWEFFKDQFTSDRIFWAFCVDAILYSVWQSWILKDVGAPAWQRRIPFLGLVGWLLTSDRG